MIEKKFKTLNGKLSLRIPTQLNEVTLGQLMEMQSRSAMTDLDAVSILSGVPMADLKNIRNIDELQAFNEHVNGLALQIKNLYNSDVLPERVTFDLGDKEISVKVISNLSIEPAGAFMASRDLIADEIAEHIREHGENDWRESFNPSLKLCAQLLGQYFYCKVTGNSYDEHDAAQFYLEVLKLPVTDALPIAKYFFLNYPNLSKLKISYWHRLRHFWSRRQALKRLKDFATSIPSTDWPAAMSPNGPAS